MNINQRFRDFIIKNEGAKRLESFFSENYFEKELKRHFDSEQISMGWLYKEINKKFLFIKFLGSKSSSDLSMADRKFIRHLLNTGNRVQIIHFNYSSDSFDSVLVDKITENLSVLTDKESHMCARKSLSQFFNGTRRKEYTGAGNSVGSNADKQIDLMFEYFSDSELLELYLFRRYILEVYYYSFGHHPVDLDAVLVLNETPIVLELKRKLPASKCYLKGNINLFYLKRDSYRKLAEKQAEESGLQIGELDFSSARKLALKGIFKQGRRSLVQSFYKDKNIEHSELKCFGFDEFPHSKFVRSCNSLGINYFQLNILRGKVDSSSLINLSNWNFKQAESLAAALITKDSFQGFNFTLGEDSGRDGDLRFQEMVPQDSYREFSGQCDFSQVFGFVKERFSEKYF